jgi:hypothetical protein
VNRPDRFRPRDAREALNNGDLDRAETIALGLLKIDPEDANALQIAVLAHAVRGDHNAILRLTRQFSAPGEQRQRIFRTAMFRARKAEQFHCAAEIAARLTSPADRNFELLTDVVNIIRATKDSRRLRALAENLHRPGNSAVVNVYASIEESMLSQALDGLNDVPASHPMRYDVVRQIQRLAHLHQNEAIIHRLGQELVRTAKEFRNVPFWLNWRAAAIQGDRDEMRRIFLLAEDQAPTIFDDEEAFRKLWKPFAQWSYNTYDVETGARIVSLALERGIADDSVRLLDQEAGPFLAEFFAEIDAARTNFKSIALGEMPSFPSNELIRVASLPKIFNLGSENAISTEVGWLRLVGEVGRQAKAAGGAITFVQEGVDELFDPAPLTLSYHTHGQRPGRMHFKEADLTEYFSLDPGGYAGWSTLASKSVEGLPLGKFAKDEVEAFFDAERRRIIEANHSKYAQDAPLNQEPLPPRYIFVAMQTRFDRVQQLARVPMLDMLDIVVRRFSGSEHRIVVKRHPRCTNNGVAETLARLAADGTIILRDDSIHSLIAGADAVVTVNSGVGSEAAIHLKPVYTFGAAEYAPIVHNVGSEADFVAKTSPIRLAVSEENIKRFVYFYRNEFLLHIDVPHLRESAVRRQIIEPALSASGVRRQAG